MNKLFCTFFFLLLLLPFSGLHSQNDISTLNALAAQAKNEGDNEKAINYYEELYRKTKSDGHFYALLELYPLVFDFKSAEKIAKARSKKFQSRPQFLVDLGHVYDLQKKEKEAERVYLQAISKVDNKSQNTKRLANSFIRYKNYAYVEKTYLKARKVNKTDNIFRFELAAAYAQQGKTAEMVDEYLTILEGNRGYIQTVQNLFQRVLHPDPDGKQMELLKDQLLRRIQKSPDKEVFSELLIWLYIQDKNFNGAFVQTKAFDKRAGEQGKRLFSLGQLSLSNKAYEVAENCFQYIVDLGDESPYYLKSKMRLVAVLKEKVTNNNTYTNEDLMKLKSNYENTIADLGKSSFTLPLLRGLAQLNAYYLDSIDQAINILEGAILLNSLGSAGKAETKIELADLMLLSGDIWEASILYSQVEKAFKYDQLGEIAKFKNAKVAFYIGDFYWAQAQLNVLKGSTSKLIANDALDLSLLITDNVGLDSIPEPLEMFARADLLIFKKNYKEANVVLDSIPKFFPASSLKDEILFTKYKILYEERNYTEAAEKLRQLIADYSYDILADDALFALAKLEEEQFENKETAMELYKQLMTNYPASLFVVESRKRFRALRGDQLEEELN